ncbi:uncharacterized protein LOC132755936 [Ruditapes philippinarum]|uniref:uncharacterized protein LOC132755936 n=1 Tax=Ruditapes philippinarum TaxID=129788 RepID=UPI00295AB3B9|nr:uncharacterized protein LOC132755936 [Ruditapes philippinarum]
MLIETPVDHDIKKTLSKFEQALCEKYIRIETKGKKGRKVAILLTKEMKRNIDFLLSLKPKSTEYIFQKSELLEPLRGHDALKYAASESCLKHPERITSTNLRKQLATLSQVLHLTESDQDILAKFMGHDIQVHRQYYRLPQGTLEIAKVSKVLHALNTGNITSVTDKDLNEISLDILDEDQSSEEEPDKEEGILAEDNTRECIPETDSDQPIRKTPGKYKKKGIRTPWSSQEKEYQTALKKCFIMKKLPSKLQCEEVINKNPVLKKKVLDNGKRIC